MHFLQIWVLPERDGLEPGYEQRAFSADDRRGRLRLNGIPLGAGGGAAVSRESSLAVRAHADAEVMLFDLA